MLKSLWCFLLIFIGFCASPAFAQSLQRADGTILDYHLLERSGDERQGIILTLHGSGCEPVIERSWLRDEPPTIAPGRAVLAIEKKGVTLVTEGDDDLQEGCTPTYWRGNTINQRVLDALQVIAHLRGKDWWDGELIIHGGSEGGAVAALLAPLVPETDAVIVVASGLGVPVWQMVQKAVPPPVAARLPDIIAEAVENPTPDKRFGGESYVWWADAAHLVPARMLASTDVPILMVHGTEDRSAPVSSARKTADLFAEAGKSNLRYLELGGLDHSMIDQTGRDRTAEVLRKIASWLDETLRE